MTRHEEAWRQDYALTALWIADRLGARPRRADQDERIKRASDELDALDGPQAGAARRFLAIEFAALTGRGGRPTPADWEAAIKSVDAAPDSELRKMSRGGLVTRAVRGGWAKTG